jgi:tRNA(Ile)-lysidine synthase
VETVLFSCRSINRTDHHQQHRDREIDYDLLVLSVDDRSWKIGDSFYPLGMDGRKKLSDFFINKKISLFEKENIPILVNGNGDILWLAKYRMDNRYKITSNTKKVLTLVCKCGND